MPLDVLGRIIVRSFLDERGRVASRRGCEWCDTRSPKSSRTRNEPRVESESSEREPFVRLSDRALRMATYSTDVFAPSDAIVANPEVSWEGE